MRRYEKARIILYHRKRFSVLALFFFLALYPGISDATIIRDISVEEMTLKSDTIVRGIVTGIETRKADEGRRIFTLVTIRPCSVYKGNVKDSFEIVVPGGILDDIGQHVRGMPFFSENNEVFLFLKTHPSSFQGEIKRFSIISMSLGAFFIEDDRASIQSENILVFSESPEKYQRPKPEESSMPVHKLKERVRITLGENR